MAAARETKVRYDIGALEQRVYGVEKAVGDISNAIAGLSTKIDERSRTPWATLVAVGGFSLALISAVGILAYQPINAGLVRHDLQIGAMQQRYVDDLHKQVERLQRRLERHAGAGI